MGLAIDKLLDHDRSMSFMMLMLDRTLMTY